MLTGNQREKMESGEITENCPRESATRKRIRENLGESIEDMVMVLKNRNMVEGEQCDVMDHINEDDVEELVLLLIDLLEDCWTIEGLNTVKGHKQELAMKIFIESFNDYDHENDPTTPDPEQFSDFVELKETVHRLDRD